MTYELREELPTVQRFQELRSAADMATRSREGVKRGLQNSVYGVIVVHEASGETVGMARIVGDVHESGALVQPIRNATRF